MDHLRKTLAALVLAPLIVFGQSAVAQDVDKKLMPAKDPFPATYADPAVPLIQLPTNFRSRRTTANISAEAGKRVEILNVKGAGCVRHLWFVFGKKNLDDLEIEIAVDEVPEPQVRMPFRSFFGVLLGFEDYHINSAGLANFPNFTITNDVHIPPKASPGWLRLEHIIQHRPAYPPTDHSYYARTTLNSDTDRRAILRLGLDNWAIIFLNGKQITMLDHSEEFETAKIPLSLRKGDNELLIKTNNRLNRDRLIWVLNCLIE